MPLPIPQVHLELERGALPVAGGTVRALLRLAVAFPEAEREREPLSLALVIDRSGSMSGPPLEHAKAAAVAAVSALRDGDRVTVVAYDDRVDVVVPSTAVGEDRTAVVRAIEAIRAGSTTALHAGWVEGTSQVLLSPVASGLGRVVLLSDGLANVGLTDPAEIAEDVARATGDGVTTSTVGLGRQFHEQMLRHLADAGQGSYTFVEAPEQLAGLFETELAGLSALRGRDVRLTWFGRGVRVVAATGGAHLDGDAIRLPDLVAGLPREALLTLEVAPDAALEGVRLAWHDAFTKAAERIDHVLVVPSLDAAAYAARPLDAAVASAVRVAELARRIADVERLTRAQRLGEAEATLQGLRAEVAGWPADAARDAQLDDLTHLLEGVRTRDVVLASKRAHSAVYERERGLRGVELRAMTASEKGWTDAHKAAKAAPPRREPRDRAAAGRAPVRVPLLRPDAATVRLEVVVGDVTLQAVDAIVNPSNRGLFGTAGVDGAVHRRGGPELTAACREIGGIDYGQAVVTAGYRLPAARVIHTTTPPWKDGTAGELATLEAAYAACFDVARRLRLRSLALPAIGTGAYGYPAEAATEVAVRVAVRELLRSPALELVRFVPFDPAMAAHYQRALAAAVPQAAA